MLWFSDSKSWFMHAPTIKLPMGEVAQLIPNAISLEININEDIEFGIRFKFCVANCIMVYIWAWFREFVQMTPKIKLDLLSFLEFLSEDVRCEIIISMVCCCSYYEFNVNYHPNINRGVRCFFSFSALHMRSFVTKWIPHVPNEMNDV